jgi:hypothetical protein
MTLPNGRINTPFFSCVLVYINRFDNSAIFAAKRVLFSKTFCVSKIVSVAKAVRQTNALPV